MTDYKKVMLTSPDAVKGYGMADYNFDDALLGDAIRKSQNVYIMEVIGERLLEKLQELVYRKIQGEDDNIDSEENEVYKVLLDDYLEEAIARKAIVLLTLSTSFKLRNLGLLQASDTNLRACDMDVIKDVRNEYETFYNDSLNRIMDYLRTNKDAIEELGDCPCGQSPLNKHYANTQLYLGR